MENLRKDIEARRAYGWPIDDEVTELRRLQTEPVTPPSQFSREMRKLRRELKTETTIIAKQSLYMVADVIAYVVFGWLTIMFLFWFFG